MAVLACLVALLVPQGAAPRFPDPPPGPPPATANPDAAASTAAEMRAYRETIPGTSAAFDMLPIPGGTFVLGSPAGEPGRKADEGPQVEVELAPFWMARCETTWDEYHPFMLALDV